ncbi:methyltransferase domain-containing protein [Rhodocytophaga rosea]|uniref:Methyltransferase domain-containing protein n=1 Tax=Rhodocytophaga rosea TaxID=2704465 RepID=A0A6C0GMB2_9BACT|nr:class I SAM-dependent methyltransferase [Rhodocytophaga rosea]QHT69165.1 methyltransferase domain-containing protein [Rhodocytophaga rosea]
MNHQEVGKYWNENAQTWTTLARAGYDVYRDHLNTPAFFEILPDIQGLKGLDIGCGEGHNTRLLAQKGAFITAIDISEVFIQQAKETETQHPLHIHYQITSAAELPFAENTFDFATAFMSLMDIPETGKVLSEACRVLKKSGFLQFSIAHPCFDTPHRKNLRNAQGKTYAIEVGDYFTNQNGDISEWGFSNLPESMHNLPKFRIPRFTRTLSEWLNIIIQAGFVIEQLHEPRPSNEVVKQYPSLQDSQVIAYFLHIRCRKS